MSQDSSDSEKISIEVGDETDNSKRGELFTTEDMELTCVLTI